MLSMVRQDLGGVYWRKRFCCVCLIKQYWTNTNDTLSFPSWRDQSWKSPWSEAGCVSLLAQPVPTSTSKFVSMGQSKVGMNIPSLICQGCSKGEFDKGLVNAGAWIHLRDGAASPPIGALDNSWKEVYSKQNYTCLWFLLRETLPWAQELLLLLQGEFVWECFCQGCSVWIWCAWEFVIPAVALCRRWGLDVEEMVWKA